MSIKRLQLALQSFRLGPLAVLRGGLLNMARYVLATFVPFTPPLLRGAAETQSR